VPRDEAGVELQEPRPPAPADAVSFDGLDRLLGYQLRRAHTVVQKDFSASLNALGLTQLQVAVLWLIEANSAISQSQLAALLLMDRATMLAIIEKLDSRGLLQRKRSKIDKRRLDLHLTDRGGSLLAGAKSLIFEHEKRFKALFSEGELLVLMDRLRAIGSQA
jgi:DNA-binding MarR family transcriptional regulator